MKTLLKISLVLCLLISITRCGGDKDDPAPEKKLPTLSINDAAGQEGTNAVFTVTLSEASTDPVTFKYKTTHGTTTDDDFVTVATATSVTILVGQTTAEISVALNEDTEDEGSEKFNVVISDPTNAELSADITGIGTINNVKAELQFFMTAKIDGDVWSAMQAGFFEPEFIGITFGSYGDDLDSQLSFVFFEDPSVPRTYETDPFWPPVDNDHVNVAYSPNFFSNPIDGPIFRAQPGGEFKITKFDKENGVAEGTFHFTAKDDAGNVHEVTDGKFRSKINDLE